MTKQEVIEELIRSKYVNAVAFTSTRNLPKYKQCYNKAINLAINLVEKMNYSEKDKQIAILERALKIASLKFMELFNDYSEGSCDDCIFTDICRNNNEECQIQAYNGFLNRATAEIEKEK